MRDEHSLLGVPLSAAAVSINLLAHAFKPTPKKTAVKAAWFSVRVKRPVPALTQCPKSEMLLRRKGGIEGSL